jgi:hypothetical protein
MYYTGIDLHKKTSFIPTVDEKGKVVKKANLRNVARDVLQYFDDLFHETKVVIESESFAYVYRLRNILIALLKIFLSNYLTGHRQVNSRLQLLIKETT